MTYDKKSMKHDNNNHNVPQYYNATTDDYEVAQGSDGASHVKIAGSDVVEQKTQADATAGAVTFLKAIKFFEIYNVDATNTGVFNVNGINITVPAGKSFKASFGGVPSASVTVTGSTSYILTRYE